MVLAVPPEHWPALKALCDRERRRGDRPRPSSSTPAGSPCAITGETVADLSMDFLHEGRPAVVRDGDVHAARAERPIDLPDRDDYTARPARDPRHLGRLQQGVDRPPVRPRGAGADRDQAAGRRPRRRAGRRLGRPAGPGLDARPGDLLRDQPALRPARPLRDGRLRDRRGDPQLRGRRRRPRPDRPPRQLLLGQHRAARDARLARPGRAGVPRPGARLRHARSSRARTA